MIPTDVPFYVLLVAFSFACFGAWRYRKLLRAAHGEIKLREQTIASQRTATTVSFEKWSRPDPRPGADPFYWIIKAGGQNYLFTEEAMKVARERVASMRAKGFLP